MRTMLMILVLAALMLATGASFFVQPPGAGGVQQAEPEIEMTFEAVSFEPEGDRLTSPDLIRVMLVNLSEVPLVDVRLELNHTPLVTFAPLDPFSAQDPQGWLINSPGNATKALGDMPPLNGRGVLLRFSGPADGCVTTTPLLIVRHAAGSKYTESDVSYSAGGACAVEALPAAGGGTGDSPPGFVAVWMVAGAGVALAAAGVVRRCGVRRRFAMRRTVPTGPSRRWG